MRSARGHLLSLAGLAGGVAVLFLGPGDRYFFGDSVAVLWARPHTWGALLKDFARLDGNLWFRPLSNSLPPFLLWPLWGMDFQPYHLLALLLHLLVVVALFEALRRLFQDLPAAFLGAAFFAFHPIQFYATYDIAFYQDPMMAGLTLGSLALFRAYTQKNKLFLLIAAMVTFALALTSKETSVVLPGCLLLLMWGEPAPRRTKGLALAAASILAGAFVYFYLKVLGVILHYQTQYEPSWSFTTTLKNAGMAMLWAFGLPAGWQTDGWKYPAALQVVLLGMMGAVLGVALFHPRSGLWRGIAWFLGAGLPAFSTNHLLPHHLYLPLMGIAFLAGGTLAHWRSRSSTRNWIGYAVPAAGLSALFVVSFLGARADAVSSWVGRSAWEVRAVDRFMRAAGVDLSDARGVLVAVGNAPHLDFDWMSGELFNLLGHEDLEVRLVEPASEERPSGFQVLEYRDHWLRNLTPGRQSKDRTTSAALGLLLEPAKVRAGWEAYRVRVPQLAGQFIDVKYRYNQRSPRVAYRLAQLDKNGAAWIPVPAGVPWGTVEVVGVRPAGWELWSPVDAGIQVVR